MEQARTIAPGPVDAGGRELSFTTAKLRDMEMWIEQQQRANRNAYAPLTRNPGCQSAPRIGVQKGPF